MKKFHSRILTTLKLICTERDAEAAILGGDDETDGRGEGGDGGAADGNAEESGGKDHRWKIMLALSWAKWA